MTVWCNFNNVVGPEILQRIITHSLPNNMLLVRLCVFDLSIWFRKTHTFIYNNMKQ